MDTKQILAFNGIQTAILQDINLGYFDVTKPVTLRVDASSRTLGAILLQDGLTTAFKLARLTPSQRQ